MKKIISLLLSALLLLSFSVSAFAVDPNFIDSAANAGSPTLEDADFPNKEDDCALIITPYNRRATLPDNGAEMELAYNSLAGMSDLSDANTRLADLAEGRILAVSDLFDARYTCTHTYHYPVTITIRDYNLSSFVALLHYVNGTWEYVESTVDGNSLTFTVDSLSPFAIIVSLGAPTSAQTGEGISYGYAAGALVFLAAAAWFFVKGRKARA